MPEQASVSHCLTGAIQTVVQHQCGHARDTPPFNCSFCCTPRGSATVRERSHTGQTPSLSCSIPVRFRKAIVPHERSQPLPSQEFGTPVASDGHVGYPVAPGRRLTSPGEGVVPIVYRRVCVPSGNPPAITPTPPSGTPASPERATDRVHTEPDAALLGPTGKAPGRSPPHIPPHLP